MSTTKKKKTAREKRVLIASIITAAAIVAGSTFAWFTSTDEVTNRLSANADYGVSIVESFAPPENWLPGQEVNKDVYATNTGNIAAFVKEEVSGVITITTVKEVATQSSECVKLSPAERYVVEDGSYLAFAPEDSTAKLGDLIVSTKPKTPSTDPSDSAPDYDSGENDFVPDKNGLYVFRRTIAVAGDQTETFEYDAYYYKDGEYYKVKLTSTTADDERDLAGDGVKTDGILSAATYSFYQENVVTAVPTLAYDEANNRLVATYTNADVTEVTNEQLEGAATALDTAEHNLAHAAQVLEKAIADSEASGSAKAAAEAALARLEKEKADLTAEKGALLTQRSTLDARRITLETAIETLNGEINGLETTLYGRVGGSESDYSTETPSLYRTYKEAEAAVAAYTYADYKAAYNAELAAYAETLGKPVNELTYNELSGFAPSSELHDIHTLTVAAKLAEKNYKESKAEYDAKVAELGKKQEELGSPATGIIKQIADINNRLEEITGRLAAIETEIVVANDAITAAAGVEGNADTSASLLAAQTAYKGALNEYQQAKITYDSLSGSFATSKDLKIYINLSDYVKPTGGVADQWQILPATVTGDKAVFYYTSILPAGKTTNMLIDSVELDESTTQEMYKNFDFDLNIGLGSVQVAYDSDNVTIKTEQVTSELGKTATLTDNKSLDTAITWS